ncbi:MAG: hypothetical protein K2X39_02780, partial [Silvanigrellaceae bacterium]|nr:hypothetical protein [Silvanigrellaceae bacterium]
FFLDFNRFLESTAKKSMEELTSSFSSEEFKKIEEKTLYRLERRHSYVIAMGETTLCDLPRLSFARKLGLVVYLRTPPKVLAERLFPLENHGSLALKETNSIEGLTKKLELLMEEREKNYLNADVIIDTAYNTLDTMKLHLAATEMKSLNRQYIQDINTIIQKRE